MNRFDLQKMAEERVADAAALLDAGRFQAAYYLCGYAIECALKACIARKTREFDFPIGSSSMTATFTILRSCSTLPGLQNRTEMRWPATIPLQRIGTSCKTGQRRAGTTPRSQWNRRPHFLSR
jgi:hypothetical protein